MNILHTSDWHLGRNLYGKKRYEEFEAFLDWLLATLKENHVDILLIAGDVFDTTTPSNKAQGLYYRFLCRVADAGCQHVVITSGNHDSPSFLDAPKELLDALHVHVVGTMPEKVEEEVFLLATGLGEQAIVCAVPYLRDRDLTQSIPGQEESEKQAMIVDGIRDHYRKVVAIAKEKQCGHEEIPLLVMGHLFAAGGKTVDGDGVRELYVGSLVHIGSDVFPADLDYVALGHLHVKQCVGSQQHIRYSGSPLPMGFGEAKQTKQVVLITFDTGQRGITEIPIPCFQQLIHLEGDEQTLLADVETLKQRQGKAWLEIAYTGQALAPNLRESLEEAIASSDLEILSIQNRQVLNAVLGRVMEEETLDDLDDQEVFRRCLDTNAVEETEREGLVACYNEIVQALHEDDENEQ